MVSAGGVVLKGDPPEVLVVSLRGGRVVTLPKGQVEPGERYPETAVREVREETGVEASVLAPLGRVRYYFTVHEPEGPVTVSKEVHYFLMRHLGAPPGPSSRRWRTPFSSRRARRWNASPTPTSGRC